MLDSLSLNPYKSTQKRDLKLKKIGFDNDLNEKCQDLFRLLQPTKQPVEEVVHESFVPFTKKEKYEVECAFVASIWENIKITCKSLQCRRHGMWLNDKAKYYVEEVKDKSGKDLDISDWEYEYVEDFPKQSN
ncbi:hypothetical protein Ddye_022490 [Dipteronia dyeriana]|uniref:Uncharacterized protein n=1 Tax=Dipteronia dyeriana TaxID=168575 RepID=A0AAD9WSF3_9ROSI|nr:hypothetical protein Ddye_022490 [Dipteronia dyeriana]